MGYPAGGNVAISVPHPAPFWNIRTRKKRLNEGTKTPAEIPAMRPAREPRNESQNPKRSLWTGLGAVGRENLGSVGTIWFHISTPFGSRGLTG